MQIDVPDHIKSAIIDAWMLGKTQDNLASEFNISTGSLSHILEQLQNNRCF
ncbi:MAG TPA: hypothetical protein VIY98_03695 [Nitrososphaeraceae archaeon]